MNLENIKNKTSIDRLWRNLLIGQNHIDLSIFVGLIFKYYFDYCSTSGIIQVNNLDAEDIKKNTQWDDIGQTSKLIQKLFDTNLLNNKGYPIKLNICSAMKKSAHDKDFLSKINYKKSQKLKQETHKISQFEAICKIFLHARNTNAHLQSPINDIGNATLIGSSILRLIELFEINEMLEDKIEKLRYNAEKIIVYCSQIIDFEDLESEKLSQEIKSDDNKDYLNENQFNNSSVKNEIGFDDVEYELPSISEASTQSYEQKKQSLLILRKEILENFIFDGKKIKKNMVILSRQSIRELLSIKLRTKNDILLSPSIIYLHSNFKELISEQLEKFSDRIFNEIRKN